MRLGFLLLLCVGAIFSMGLLMVFDTTSAEVLDRSLQISTHQALVRQIIYGIIGCVLGSVVVAFRYQSLIRMSPLLLFFCVVALGLVFVPHIGQEINGARRWIGFFGYTLQPSEGAKYILPIYFIYRIQEKGVPENFKSFLKLLSVFLVPIGLIFLEPDNGTTGILLAAFFAFFVLVRIRFLYWFVPLIVMVFIGSIAAYQMPHVRDRLRVYLHPETDLKGKGHQPYQAKIAAGSGRLFGKGLGESMQKLDYLPEARNDYIAAIYAEEFGFFGICGLIGLYMAVTYLGFSIACQARDREGFYLAAMMTFMISFQAFLNLGVVSGLLPSKGTTLPFFSQGGTSLMMNLMALFLIFSVAKQSSKAKGWVEHEHS